MRMSQTYVDGSRVPVTLVSVKDCIVTQVKKMETDGYWAVQLGSGSKKIKNITKPLQNHLKKSQAPNSKLQTLPHFTREVRMKEEPKEKVGDILKPSDIFNSGDSISVTGVSKGKGFAGGVKRWHFSGGPKTHGQSDRQRAPGSIGQGTTPGRVYKGKHMAGRMGSEQTKIKGLKIVGIDAEKNEILVSGPIPGRIGSLVVIQKVASKK